MSGNPFVRPYASVRLMGVTILYIPSTTPGLPHLPGAFVNTSPSPGKALIPDSTH